MGLFDKILGQEWQITYEYINFLGISRTKTIIVRAKSKWEAETKAYHEISTDRDYRILEIKELKQ